MRVAVTGGAGFLGSHLVDRLVDRGDEVVAIDNFATGEAVNLESALATGRCRLIEADVTEGMPEVGPVDLVFHFASPASPVDFVRMPFDVLRVNSEGTLHALDFAERHRAVFFLASTSEVYGDPLVNPQPETYLGNVNPIGPRAVYDESKRFAEAATMAAHRHRGLDVRIVRFFNTYGPRMRLDDGRVVPNLVGQALRGEPLTIYGDGRQTRSFGYVDDIIDGVLRLAASDRTLPVNLGSQEEFAIRDFAETVLRLTGSPSGIAHLPALEDDPRQRRPDLTRAREWLGWAPTTPLEEGLRRTINAFRDQLAA